jgi:geranylgeranyl pyrophosphate synthase
MSTESKHVFVVAKWSEDVSAYIATIDGKVAIITLAEEKKTPSVAKARTAGAAAPKAKAVKRAKRLSAEDTEKATKLIVAGKSLEEVQQVVPGVVKNIYARLKRSASTAAPTKAAKAKPTKKSKAKV